MKSLNISETLKHLGEDIYAVSLESDWYRRELYRKDQWHSLRVGRLLDLDAFLLPHFALSLANWLPKHTHRLLWIEHIDQFYPSQKRNFIKLLGRDLSSEHLVEYPGILLGPFSEDLMHEEAATLQQVNEAEALSTLTTLLCVGSWDAKLLTSGSTDFVEFWEGNILFHSNSSKAIDKATEIFDFYKLKTPLK